MANDDFRVDNPREIAATLRRIAQQNEQVYLLGEHGELSLMSTLLEVDEKAHVLYLDCSANDLLNEQLLKSTQVVFESRLNQVMIRFDVDSLVRVQRENYRVFKLNIPSMLLRMEHREFFRVRIPLTRPLACRLSPEVEGKLVDISSGGMCLQLSNDANLSLQEGECYEAKLEVGPGEWTDVRFAVQRTWQEISPRGDMRKHAGCRFENLSSRAQSLIDRLVLKLQVDTIAQARH